VARRNPRLGAAFILGGALFGGVMEAVVAGTASAIAAAALIGAAVGLAFWLLNDVSG
jgi:hypothetical protein